MQLDLVRFNVLRFILFLIIFQLTKQSPTQSDSSSTFDWTSFLNDAQESSVISAQDNSALNNVQSDRKSLLIDPKRVSKQSRTEEERRKRRNENRRGRYKVWNANTKAKFEKLSETEKAKVRKRRSETQRRHSAKIKSLTGYVSRSAERLGKARIAKQNGTITKEQEQLLQKEYDRKRKYKDKKWKESRKAKKKER